MFDTLPTVASGSDLHDVPTERLEAETCSFASTLAAANCRWLLLVGELDRRESWRSWGCRGMTHWLSWKCGLAGPTAREQLAVARTLPDLPALTAEFAAGRLSYSKVRALIRVAIPETEQDLIDLARTSTAEQLERIVSAYLRCAEATSTADAQALAQQRRGVWFRGTRHATFRLSAELSERDYKILKTRLDELAKEVPADTVADANDPTAARKLDALVRLAEGSEPAQLTVHAHIDVADVIEPDLAEPAGLDADVSGARNASADAFRVREAQARRRRAAAYLRLIGCDARISLDLDQRGSPIDLGRTHRHPSRRLRRAVLHRDGYRCRWAACDHRAEHVHHLLAWVDGGPTDAANLVSVCRYHHRMLHPGGWKILGDPTVVGQLRFTDGAGHFGERPDLPSDASADALSRFPTADLHATIYDPLDLDLALTALIGLLGPPARAPLR